MVTANLSERIEKLQAAREIARQNLLTSVFTTAEKANRNNQFKKFKPADIVMLKRDVIRGGKITAEKYSGPYRIVNEHRGNTYFITCDNWADHEKVLVHAAKLKRTQFNQRPRSQLTYTQLKARARHLLK